MNLFPANRDLSIRYRQIVVDVRRRERPRLDVFLTTVLAWNSRQSVQRAIEAGRVRVNETGAKPAQRVQPGDRIQIEIDLARKEVPPLPRADLAPPIWEDAYILALNKPPGWLVHPVGKTVTGTLLDELHARYRAANAHGTRRSVAKLCHRLDRDTSGLLLVAKTDLARRRIQQAFEDGLVEKRYLAVVEGRPARARFDIDLPIAVRRERAAITGNTLAEVSDHGKPSVTTVECLATVGDLYAIVRCGLLTGRQNQIRAHLAEVGHPILGDVGYGSRPQKMSPSAAQVPAFPERALLHSHTLSFPHPIWGHTVRLAAPPPADMRPFLTPASYSA